MNRDSALKRLMQLISVYADDRGIDNSADLMGYPVNLPPHEMAALFLDIEKEFSVDLNQLLPELELFSVNEIAEKISDR